MQRPARHRWARHARALALLVLAAALLPGCLDDPIQPTGPLTLLQAHDRAQSAAHRIDRSASLIGFVGHEGSAPGFLDARLAPHVAPVDNPTDTTRADGRTGTWALLYGTESGTLLRAEFQEGVLTEVGYAAKTRDPDVQALWWLNLGGRLLVDSPQAVAAVRQSAQEIAAHLEAHPDQGVVYASTLAPRDSPGGPVPDLAYEIFFDHGGSAQPFAHFARVSHFSPQVLAHGDAASHAAETRQVLFNETFRLHPLAPSLHAEAPVPYPVKAPTLAVHAEGHGTFRLEIQDPQGKPLARIDEPLLIGARSYERRLPALSPGNHTVAIETMGDITFRLTVEGTVGP